MSSINLDINHLIIVGAFRKVSTQAATLKVNLLPKMVWNLLLQRLQFPTWLAARGTKVWFLIEWDSYLSSWWYFFHVAHLLDSPYLSWQKESGFSMLLCKGLFSVLFMELLLLIWLARLSVRLYLFWNHYWLNAEMKFFFRSCHWNMLRLHLLSA